MMLQDYIIVFFIAVLSGLGVGSGGLLIIYLTAVYSFSQIEAQSTNLVFFVFAAGASLLWHYTQKKTQARELLPIALGGIAGSFFGSRVASVTDEKVLSSLFGVLLVISGVITLYNTVKGKIEKRKNERK